jgi:hypothetical protein
MQEKVMKKIIFLITILIFTLSLGAHAAIFTVDQSGNGDYTSIQACANDVGEGDTCKVYSGTYSESVTIKSNGSPGNWITFQAAAGNSSVMTGGWNIAGHKYIVIDGFSCGGIKAKSFVSHIKILNSLIHDTRIGISLIGNDVLISGNTFNNMGDDMVRQFGDRWTIRNNVVIDESDTNDEHMDFWQSWCNPVGVAAAYFLIENNTYINVGGGNTHFTLINGTSSCNDPTTNSIIRYNKIYNIGSIGSYVDSNRAVSGSTDNVIYNNTWVKLNEGSSPRWQNFAHNYNASANSSSINNIYFDAMYHAEAKGVEWKSGGAQSYNLYFDSDYTMTFSGLATNEVGAVKNKNPRLKNPGHKDFSLKSGSPAIDHGGPLTHVASDDSGSGTSLIVDAAEFFQPGWGGALPDTIAIGSVSNVATISSINYTTNKITLATSISRSVGDPVYLYKDSDGTRVLYGPRPDIGAVESPGNSDFGNREIPSNLRFQKRP